MSKERCARCGHGKKSHPVGADGFVYQCTARRGDGPWNQRPTCWCSAFIPRVKEEGLLGGPEASETECERCEGLLVDAKDVVSVYRCPVCGAHYYQRLNPIAGGSYR